MLTHSHMYPHTHICMHTHRVYVHTHTATHACTRITHSHTCTHTIIYTYTVTTHTHRHKPKSHTHHACTTTDTCTHMHTACPGFGGPWSPLPVDPGTLGYLKVRGVYVRLITKPSSLGSGPRSPRGHHPGSLHGTDTSREKEVLRGSSQGWKWISQFPHALCFQSLLMQRRSTCFTDPHRVASEAAAGITGKGQPGAPQHPGGPGRSWLQRQRSV